MAGTPAARASKPGDNLRARELSPGLLAQPYAWMHAAPRQTLNQAMYR